MTQLHEIKVQLSPNQKKTINTAHNKKETIIIRLSKDSLSGNDSLNVPTMIKKRLEKIVKTKKAWILNFQNLTFGNKMLKLEVMRLKWVNLNQKDIHQKKLAGW